MNNGIGEAAGAIWGVLKENGPLTTAKIKTQTNLESDSIMLGLGWLAREEKINLEKTGKKRIEVSLR